MKEILERNILFQITNVTWLKHTDRPFKNLVLFQFCCQPGLGTKVQGIFYESEYASLHASTLLPKALRKFPQNGDSHMIKLLC